MQLRPHQERAVAAMLNASKGKVIVPTGGGKTLTAITDLNARLSASQRPLTAVVVCPRLLLVNQLCEEYMEVLNTSITNIEVIHVHSGDTHFYNTTKSEQIVVHTGMCLASERHQLIFTTYHSLHKIVDAGIDIDVAYFDEAHNACSKQFFPKTAAISMMADKAFFFTATPRISKNPHGRGMNNKLVFGDTIENTTAQELIESGSIIPPMVTIHSEDSVTRTKDTAARVDAQTVLNIVDDLDADSGQKVLIAAPSTKVIGNMIGHTSLLEELEERGYDILHITSKLGAYVNRKKVNRQVFFETLTEWGKDKSRKFVLLHYSILSEGINVPGLTHCVLLRNLNIVEMAQTIGRVIRMDRQDAADIASGALVAGDVASYRKSYGFVTVPVYGNHGAQIQKRLQSVVDCIFVKGVPATSIVA